MCSRLIDASTWLVYVIVRGGCRGPNGAVCVTFVKTASSSLFFRTAEHTKRICGDRHDTRCCLGRTPPLINASSRRAVGAARAADTRTACSFKNSDIRRHSAMTTRLGKKRLQRYRTQGSDPCVRPRTVIPAYSKQFAAMNWLVAS